MSRADRRRLGLRSQVALDIGTVAMLAEHAAKRADAATRITRIIALISIVSLALILWHLKHHA